MFLPTKKAHFNGSHKKFGSFQVAARQENWTFSPSLAKGAIQLICGFYDCDKVTCNFFLLKNLKL